MTAAAPLLGEAWKAGLRLWVEGAEVRLAAASEPDPALLEKLRANKEEVRELLLGGARPMPWHGPARAASKPADDRPRPWADDRAWLLSLRQAPGCRARTDTLAAWVAAAGGQVADGTALLPPLRPHAERRLAEVELRRVLRDARVACVDDPTLVLPDPAAPPPSRADEEQGDDRRPADLPRLPARELPRLAHRRHPGGADAERARWLGAEPRPQRLRDAEWLRQRVQDPETRARAEVALKLDGRSLDAIAAGGAGLASWQWKRLREALGP